MNINETKLKKIKKDLIVQANNADLMMDIIIFLKEHMATKKGIGQLTSLSDRQVDYYSEALGAMEVTDYLQVGSKTFLGLKPTVDIDDNSEFADHLRIINFVKKQTALIHVSALASATKDRRLSGIHSLEKWIKKH